MNELLGNIKREVDANTYALILRLLDSYHMDTDRISILARHAELNCLNKHKFDIPDYLSNTELVEYMKLDNEDKIKFGMQPEWSEAFINQVINREVK